MKHFLKTASAAAVLLASFSASAADIKPSVVFDMGGKFDKSFNEGVYNGLEKFKSETGIKYREFEVTNEAQREQAIRRMAKRGSDIVLGIGFAQNDALAKVAGEYPNAKFAIIDGWATGPNIQAIGFKEHEGSFLVGMVAALKSKTGVVGFVGGMDIPLIRRFACGYVQGAKHANSGVKVIQNMTGTTPSAWNDPSRGGELTKGQFAQGADVVFAAAGGTGVGVYQAAKDAGKFAIGVDSNQNHLHPGTMLTSMIKRVDVAAYNTFMDVKKGTWEAKSRYLGLAEDGVGWAIDKHNRALISADMESKVEAARMAIIAGKIKVHDYMNGNKCNM
ncbi:MAG: BMP family ABC transporter substrate-binding protein [Alphaproteobacteria bacterium]|jgi:basic membrane protein A and related proteins|nr:BMP family ABC transporter substrate-binding protein [Alphaproteobacteria bacterium]MBT4019798.1 BMP family ABC transporter substrate-binding protein [Alphaproteobacteria bacterium]MBT4966202.1 BMP family ABC transporter substrate-binding protein [Alphaproteobacteria bacterium]MBT5917395.1 BMP family ABC transporter substrate-binding protein [Alphaproteobacteria bacterium]MBT6384246.1 BMP family ABC transporter substrate-binding protein [Alphaproteobacteria bacterium]